MKHNPPPHLSDRCQEIWAEILHEYQFSVSERETLRLGLEALDRAEEARVAVEAAGPYFVDRYGQPRPHPGIAVEHTARLDFLKTVRELALTEALDAPHPPAIPGRYVRGPER